MRRSRSSTTGLRLVLRFAVRRDALPANPAEQLTAAERPKAGLGRQRVLDKHEMEQLLSAATERYRVAIACGLFAGLRLSEPGGAPHRTAPYVMRLTHEVPVIGAAYHAAEV
jgi:site-specific recombinase XerC